MTARDTSVSAFRCLDLQGQEEALMKLVHLHFPFPKSFTRKEFAAKTSWEINRICGRVNSLVEKGYLKEYPQIRDGGHLLSISPPKTAAPAPVATGESAKPFAASVAPDKPGPPSGFVNAPPGLQVVHERMIYDDKGKPFYVAVGYGPGWPPDQDHLHAKRRAG